MSAAIIASCVESFLVNFLSKFLGKILGMIKAKYAVKAKLPYSLHSENQIAARTRNILGKESLEVVTKKYTNPIVLPYKIELADAVLKDVLEKLPLILEEIKALDIYLLDLDITQDFAGIFNKADMSEYLISNHNFRLAGTSWIENYNTIVKNDKTVGIDCLTWMTPGGARVKIYNKFVCQVTSPGVAAPIGNHIVDFANCPDARLKQTFASDLAKEHGITRLEATIYNSDSTNCIEACKLLLEEYKPLFRSAPFYSVSIPKMWAKICDNLHNSCCLVVGNLLQYVYWGNKNTRKLTGVQSKFSPTA